MQHRTGCKISKAKGHALKVAKKKKGISFKAKKSSASMAKELKFANRPHFRKKGSKKRKIQMAWHRTWNNFNFVHFHGRQIAWNGHKSKKNIKTEFEIFNKLLPHNFRIPLSPVTLYPSHLSLVAVVFRAQNIREILQLSTPIPRWF